MIECIEEQKHVVELIMTKALTQEAISLWEAGNKSATRAIFSYMAIADQESLVRLHDIIMSTKSN